MAGTTYLEWLRREDADDCEISKVIYEAVYPDDEDVDDSFWKTVDMLIYSSNEFKLQVKDWRTLSQNKDALQTLVKSACSFMTVSFACSHAALHFFNADHYTGRASGPSLTKPNVFTSMPFCSLSIIPPDPPNTTYSLSLLLYELNFQNPPTLRIEPRDLASHTVNARARLPPSAPPLLGFWAGRGAGLSF